VDEAVFDVAEFKEKPDAARACDYVAAGYLWNSGNFMMRASAVLEDLSRFAPDVSQPVARAVDGAVSDLDFRRLDGTAFREARKISIDYAVMEKTSRAAVVRADFDWSDIGSWNAMWELAGPNGDGNVLIGEVETLDVRNSFVQSEGRLTTVLGLDDVVVVTTEDAVLVGDRRRTEDVKKLVDKLSASRPNVVANHVRMYRPWGYYQTLDLGDRHQVKRIVVKPGAKLSLQKHFHRAEHWVVVRGTAIVHIDGTDRMLRENESVYIPLGAVHRMENPGSIPLELIEVQSGSYLGEDDIVRIEDIYNRAI
jgi:mannose-1-phosphate guanylyltransferase/mannose-1-phosphate guanylyltransferase/mannose-6-phosphate isomerase